MPDWKLNGARIAGHQLARERAIITVPMWQTEQVSNRYTRLKHLEL